MDKKINVFAGAVCLISLMLVLNCSGENPNTSPTGFTVTSEGDGGPMCAGTVYEIDQDNNVIGTLTGAYILVRTWPGGSESYGYCYSGAWGIYECYNNTAPPYFNPEGTYCTIDCSKEGFYSRTKYQVLLPQSNPVDFGLIRQ